MAGRLPGDLPSGKSRTPRGPRAPASTSTLRRRRHAELSERECAIVDFAVKVTREPAAVEDADLARLRAQGLAEADIWDAGAVAAFFNLSNRMASLADLRPNREFHAMGRR